MRFQAVIFDLDGTLVDSLADLGESMNLVLAQLGLPGHPLDAYRHFVGEGLRVLAARALPEQMRSDEMIDRATTLMLEIYSQRLLVHTRPYAGIRELLEGLEASGLKLAVLSNKMDGPTQKITTGLLADCPFAAVFGSRPGVPKKPSPAGALEIAERLGVPPECFLYLGDTAIDMQTAAAAGMFSIGVLWGFRPAGELIRGGAKMLLSHPTHLLPFL